MIKTDKQKLKKFICITLVVTLTLAGVIYYLQNIHAHVKGYFVPEYERVNIDQNTDYETIFLQTGLGASAVEKLKNEGKFDEILTAQENFFNPPKVNCNNMLSVITKEERFDDFFVEIVDLQPGDILLSLSTHTLGWRHGHAGLVIDEENVLEAEIIGTNSKINPLYHFGTYGNFVHLRLRDITPEMQSEIVEFSKEYLNDIQYGLGAGFVGEKAPPYDSEQLRVQCSYLVWYAYNYFGYDIDSDGGRLVSTYDILHSDKLEVVQLFGMNPKEFI